MVKISIVYVARDDRYGDDYNVVDFPSVGNRNKDYFKNNFTIKYNNIERIKFTLENNKRLMDKYFIDDYEIIFVDWNPINKEYLFKNSKLEILKDEKITNIIVTSETIEKRGLNKKGFYEYFGKNVGIRNSMGNYVLISNPDDVFTEELVKEMKEKVTDKKEYYRCEWRIDVDHNLKEIARGLSFPKNGKIEDEIIGTPASGDFTLASKDAFIDVGGYLERISNGNETFCDGRLLIKMYRQGYVGVKLNGDLMHLDHKKHDRSGAANDYWQDDYINEDSWGFNDFEIEELEKNIYRL